MAFETFTPPIDPSPGTNRSAEYKILEAPFGDGYGQPVGDGLNYIRQKVSITWEALTDEQADEILNFMIPRAKTTPFWFRAPRFPGPTKWTCDDWSDTMDSGRRKVSLTLVQSFLLD